MSTITKIQEATIAEYLKNHTIPAGLGTAEAACSVAAINLALTGTLTDDIPECMSLVIGRWIIKVQDAMPSEMRNSAEYKALLPLAAGTGRNPNHEQARLALILDWMWEAALLEVQPMADKGGFGEEWAVMYSERTREAASAAARAALAAVCVAAADARAAFYAAAADAAVCVAAADARAAVYVAAADAADAAARAVAGGYVAAYANAAVYAAAAGAAARAAVWVATADAAARGAAAERTGNTGAFWASLNPLKLLADLIAVA